MWFWELNSVPLEEQLVLLTIKSSLQSPKPKLDRPLGKFNNPLVNLQANENLSQNKTKPKTRNPTRGQKILGLLWPEEFHVSLWLVEAVSFIWVYETATDNPKTSGPECIKDENHCQVG